MLQILGTLKQGFLTENHFAKKPLAEKTRSVVFDSVPYLEKKMAIYCPQGSGMLRQLLLMMH